MSNLWTNCLELNPLKISFAQWHYHSQWGSTEAWWLVIENFSQYPARRREIPTAMQCFEDSSESTWINENSNANCLYIDAHVSSFLSFELHYYVSFLSFELHYYISVFDFRTALVKCVFDFRTALVKFVFVLRTAFCIVFIVYKELLSWRSSPPPRR